MDQGPAFNQALLPNMPTASAPAAAVPPAPATQPPPPVVIIMQAPVDTGPSTKEHYRKTFQEKYALALSIFCIVVGVLSSVFQVVLICMSSWRYDAYYGHVSQGIWCGFWYILAGGFGIAAAKKPSPCTVITLMVLSIFAACMTVPLVVLSGIGTTHRRSSGEIPQGFYAAMLVMGLLAGIASVILSAMTCRTACCAKKKSRGTVVYNPSTVPQAAAVQAIPLGDIAQAINTNVIYQPQQQQLQPQTGLTPPPDYSELGKQTQNESQSNETQDTPDGDADYKRFY